MSFLKTRQKLPEDLRAEAEKLDSESWGVKDDAQGDAMRKKAKMLREEADGIERRIKNQDEETEKRAKRAKALSELAAAAAATRGRFVVAVITTRLPGGRRRAISIVNVDITGKKVSRLNLRIGGSKMVYLEEGLRFTVNGRSYELDSEFIEFEIPLPTLFYDREKSEPIHFYERTLTYKSQEISSIDLIGHYSLRLDKMLEQKVVETAANERPEPPAQAVSKLVIVLIAVFSFMLGVLFSFLVRP